MRKVQRYTRARKAFSKSRIHRNKVRAMTDANKAIIDQTVVHGTLLTADLVKSFTDEYARIGGRPSNVKLFRSHLLLADGQEREELLSFDLEDLFELLDELAPEGTTFCSHPGDGSDFGFWTYEDEGQNQ